MVKIVAFNKPFDVHSQFRGEGSQITLANFISDDSLRVAGRLDRDSEGLMLLTDNGAVNQHITNPKFKQYKTYLAQVDGQITEEAILRLQQGVELNDGLTLPAKVRMIDAPEWLWQRDPPVRFRANIPTSWVEIQICEGRNRQVRRMTAAVGFPTLRLIRTQIGSVNLLDLGLESGDQRTLEPLFYDEFQQVVRQAKLTQVEDKPTSKTAPRSKKDLAQAKQNKKRAKIRAEIFKSDDTAKPKRITNGTTRANTKQRGRRDR
jgi:23S rRNA pseudouridine2457 synthase